jgi:hypothetical protein
MIDLVLFILLGIVTVALAVFGGHVSSANRKHRIAFYAMGGISVVLIVLIGLRNYEAQIRLDKSIDSLQKSSETVANMSKETVRIGQLNTQLQERILQQSKTISGLSKECINTAIGGDSFGYVSADDLCFTNRWIPKLIIKGKYPLYAVQATIFDIGKLMKLLNQPNSTLAQFDSERKTINFGDPVIAGYGVDTMAPDKTFPITGDGMEHRYAVSVFARNGTWKQELKVINVNGKCSYATRVYKDNDKKRNLLFEDISDEFPIDRKAIKWSKNIPFLNPEDMQKEFKIY